MCRIITSMLILLTAFIGMPCLSTAANFQDVLNTPAVKSTRADKSFFNGIVLAGKRLVSVGRFGYILYSDDKGKSWTQATVPLSSDLVAVNFPTPQKGWAVGHDGVVLHSEDGGATWVKQLDGRAAAEVMAKYYTEHPPKILPGVNGASEKFTNEIKKFVEDGPDKPFLDVFFENETSGFIIGAFNLIFHTADGGKSWETWYDRTDNLERKHMYAIRSIGGDIYIVGEQGLIMKLDRKVSLFRKITTPYAGTYFGITGKSEVVIAFGMRGNVFRTINKGAGWNKIETGVIAGLTGGTVTEDGRIILVSQGGDALVCQGDCEKFSRISMEDAFPAAAVAATENDTIVLAGLGGMKVQKLK